MNIETLLGEISKTKFVQEYFHRLPFSLAGAARSVCQLRSWEVLGEILGQDGMDVMVVREARRLRDEARQSIFEYIELFHNRVRRHSALGNKNPAEFEQAT